jgi:hypothetical protein
MQEEERRKGFLNPEVMRRREDENQRIRSAFPNKLLEHEYQKWRQSLSDEFSWFPFRHIDWQIRFERFTTAEDEWIREHRKLIRLACDAIGNYNEVRRLNLRLDDIEEEAHEPSSRFTFRLVEELKPASDKGDQE